MLWSGPLPVQPQGFTPWGALMLISLERGFCQRGVRGIELLTGRPTTNRAYTPMTKAT